MLPLNLLFAWAMTSFNRLFIFWIMQIIDIQELNNEKILM